MTYKYRIIFPSPLIRLYMGRQIRDFRVLSVANVARVKLVVQRRTVSIRVQGKEAVRLGCCPRTIRSRWRAITATVFKDIIINPELVR